MKAVVLAGTYDWGQCPLTFVCPRPLLPVANRPLVAYALAALTHADIAHVAVCANGDTGRLRAALGENASRGLRLEYIEDSMPRGPAGCARDAAFLLGDDHFIVVEGGLLPDVDLRPLVARHLKTQAALTVAVEEAAEGRNGSGMGSRPLGIYAFASRVLEHIPLRGYQDIKESLIPRLYELGETVSLCPLPGTTRRVMGPASYLTVNHHAVERLPDGAWPLAGYEQIGEAFVHPTAWVAPSARLAGPVVVGPGAVVHERAAVIGPASIGAACDIGSRSVVCFSALWDGVRIGTDCHVDGSILASGVQVPAGSKAVNLVRLSRSENADCNVNSELDLAVAPPRAVKNRAGRREGAADVGPPARRTPAASNEHR